jgi:hypothetical protein
MPTPEVVALELASSRRRQLVGISLGFPGVLFGRATDTRPDDDAHADSDCYSNADDDADCYIYADRHANIHGDTDSNHYAYSDADGIARASLLLARRDKQWLKPSTKS